MITKQALEEFKALYLEYYGVKLTDADATEKACNLLNLFRTVYSRSDKRKSANCE